MFNELNVKFVNRCVGRGNSIRNKLEERTIASFRTNNLLIIAILICVFMYRNQKF